MNVNIRKLAIATGFSMQTIVKFKPSEYNDIKSHLLKVSIQKHNAHL